MPRLKAISLQIRFLLLGLSLLSVLSLDKREVAIYLEKPAKEQTVKASPDQLIIKEKVSFEAVTSFIVLPDAIFPDLFSRCGPCLAGLGNNTKGPATEAMPCIRRKERTHAPDVPYASRAGCSVPLSADRLRDEPAHTSCHRQGHRDRKRVLRRTCARRAAR